MNYLDHLDEIAVEDINELRRKEATYKGSWKKRGGIGAFMMMARKWDRLENLVQSVKFDIFHAMTGIAPAHQGRDGTALAEIRDLRRYLMLIEAEMMAHGAVPSKRLPKLEEFPGSPADGGHHAQQEEN